ncbi:helix-turn-helix domain-containing protein [Oscillibacter sp.]|uniref:helix-turn-helix domain-containing protein n=1 Tax=Oscillibacter sp. TaxID=1945593 RepID=UPI0028A154D6|nr:helix-turn-helix domain-containing protein [Oscillibacter sp.]
MREKAGFRDQYQTLRERFADREVITIEESSALLGLDRRVLLNNGEFPAKKVGKKYIIPLVALARWMS